MKDQSKISNQVGEINHAAKELGVNPVMIHLAKAIVGNDRKTVYKWVKGMKSTASICLPTSLIIHTVSPDETKENSIKPISPVETINNAIKDLGGAGEISDGYHTFNELYDHRITLFIALCKQLSESGHTVWRSSYHSDGELAFGGGWFVLGINRVSGQQITYHLPEDRWDDTLFAETQSIAPTFDGHTAADVLDRIKTL